MEDSCVPDKHDAYRMSARTYMSTRYHPFVYNIGIQAFQFRIPYMYTKALLRIPYMYTKIYLYEVFNILFLFKIHKISLLYNK